MYAIRSYYDYPMFKHKGFGVKWLTATDRIPVPDYIIAGLACFSALYIAIYYEDLTTRYGSPTLQDLVFGAALVILLLEAARRVIGPALPAIALAFCGYAFFRITSYNVCYTKLLRNITNIGLKRAE